MKLPALLVVSAILVVALLLTVIRMPPGFPAWLGWLRPDWVVLVMLYWVMAVPQQVGLTTAWIAGLLVDIMTGNLLGQHALGLVVVAWASFSLYERLRMYAMLQQAVIVFFAVLLVQCIDLSVEVITRDLPWTWWVLAPAATSALLWPFAFDLQRAIRRYFRIT